MSVSQVALQPPNLEPLHLCNVKVSKQPAKVAPRNMAGRLWAIMSISCSNAYGDVL